MGLSVNVNPGGAAAFQTASGGKVYGYNNIAESAAIPVAPASPSRVSIIFHNPGTSDIFVAPATVQNTLGTVPTTKQTNTALTLTNAALGGSFLVFGNGGVLTVTGECQGAWQALAVTGAGSTNPLTVMDSNI